MPRLTTRCNRLTQNPHDAVSEDILNDALNDKVALLKEFADSRVSDDASTHEMKLHSPATRKGFESFYLLFF